jgi:hypothetical protein
MEQDLAGQALGIKSGGDDSYSFGAALHPVFSPIKDILWHVQEACDLEKRHNQYFFESYIVISVRFHRQDNKRLEHIMKIRLQLLASVLLLISSLSFAGVEVNVYDDVVYLYLDKLNAAGLLKAYMPNQRPLARNVIAALVAEARKNVGSTAGPMEPFIRELEQEFADSLVGSDFQWSPLESASMSFTATNQEESLSPDNGLGATTGRVQPLLSYNYGDRFERYASGYFNTVHKAKVSGYFSAYLQPKFYVREGASDTSGIGLYRGYVKTGYRNFEVQFGRDDVRWGPGENGIFFSGNARSLDMVKASTPGAFRLPGFLKYAGYFRGTAFVSWLGDSVHPKGASLSGYRIDYSPFKWMDIGFDHAVFMGGKGGASPSLGQAIKGFIGFLGTSGLDKATTNHLIGVDAVFRIKKAMGMELYGKMLFEDTQKERVYMLKNDISYLGGIFLPKITGLERLSMRLEGNYSGPFLYKHGFYVDGFAINHKFIGYDAGADTYSGLLTSNYQFGFDEFIKVDLRYLRRSADHFIGIFDSTGDNVGVARDMDRPEESHFIFKFSGQKKLSKFADLFLEVGYDRKHNADFVNGRTANDLSLQARVNFRRLSSLIPRRLNLCD